MQNLNLNETVRVKWTEAGLRAVEDKHRADLGAMADSCSPVDGDTDADGYASLQLWELMGIIGPHLKMGMGGVLIERNEILFDLT